MTAVMLLVIAGFLGIATAIPVALIIAHRVSDRAVRRALDRIAPRELTREERIARARACLEACRGAELALEAFVGRDVHASMMVSAHREMAAHARAELRLMGVER
jgi:hypothetical protein